MKNINLSIYLNITTINFPHIWINDIFRKILRLLKQNNLEERRYVFLYLQMSWKFGLLEDA